MIQYPLQFKVKAKAPAGIAGTWTTESPGLPVLTCAIPTEFQGPGGGFSPEDFYAMAVANCFVATFKVIAEKSKVEFESLEIQGSLHVDRDEAGRPWMKSVMLDIHVKKGSADRERLDRTLIKASQSCLVEYSIETDVQFQFQIIE